MTTHTRPPTEKIDHPNHYNEHPADIECIEVIEHMSLNIGNAIKYLWRAGLKPGSEFNEDMGKAIWYIERERERILVLDNKRNEKTTKELLDVILKEYCACCCSSGPDKDCKCNCHDNLSPISMDL